MCSKFISIELFVLVIKSFLVDIIALHVMHEFVFTMHCTHCIALVCLHSTGYVLRSPIVMLFHHRLLALATLP